VLRAFGLPPDALKAPREPRAARPGDIRYPYLSAKGQLLFEVVRRPQVPRGPKRFLVKSHATSAQKGYVYRLPELLAAPVDETVFWVEGEKDVETLRARGLVAVTTALGAYSFDSAVAHHFRGRRVVILPDNDQPGRMYARSVAAALQGVAASVYTVELPGLAEKGDVSDWLAHGGRFEDLLKAAQVPAFFRPARAAPAPASAPSAASPLGRLEMALLEALRRAEHGSLRTDALPMLVAGLAGQEGWNARGKEPITRYPHVDRRELAKARASISRALRGLLRRGLAARTGARYVRLTAAGRRFGS
jgi:hypothetical protein